MTAHVDRKWFMSEFQRKRLSQNKVADMIGLDRSALSRALAGKRKFAVAEVAKIATVLGVSQADVLKHMAPDNMSARDEHTPSPEALRHSGFGFMKGLLTIEEGYDLTSPSDEDWESGYLGEDKLNG